MPAKELGSNEEPTVETVESPDVVSLSMPRQLFDMLEWNDGDGLEWSYIDKERVLVRRVPKVEEVPVTEVEVM